MKVELLRRYLGAFAAISAVLVLLAQAAISGQMSGYMPSHVLFGQSLEARNLQERVHGELND